MPYASNGLYLETEAGYYKLSSEAYGFVARIDGSGNFQILLSDRHFNKTCGLCGNSNVFAEDDFRTQEGKLFWAATSWRRGYAGNSPAHKPSPWLLLWQASPPPLDRASVHPANPTLQHSISLPRLPATPGLGAPQA